MVKSFFLHQIMLIFHSDTQVTDAGVSHEHLNIPKEKGFKTIPMIAVWHKSEQVDIKTY